MADGKLIYPPTSKDWGLLLIRVMLSVVFIYHGSQKLFGAFNGPGMTNFEHFIASTGAPMPHISAYLSALTEFLGGIILLLGTGLRLAAIPLAFNMAVAVWVTHKGGFSAPTGCEYPLVLGVIFLAFIVMGPGRLTLGALLRGARTGSPGTVVSN